MTSSTKGLHAAREEKERERIRRMKLDYELKSGPVISGRSKDRRRTKNIDLPDERPRRKGARPGATGPSSML